MKPRRFKNYNTLFDRLDNLKIKPAGKHVTFLFETFVLNGGRLYADTVRSRGLLKNGEVFKEWRSRMVHLNLIEFYYNADNPKLSKYKPGFKIIDLVNEEILLRSEVGTKQYIDEEVEKLKAVIRHMINKLDPPLNDKTFHEYITGTDKPKTKKFPEFKIDKKDEPEDMEEISQMRFEIGDYNMEDEE